MTLKLPTMDQVAASRRGPFDKGTTRKQVKAKKQRDESLTEKVTRASCVLRDVHCRICDWEDNPDDVQADDLPQPLLLGPSEWAHMHARRRSKTRGQAPEVRHDTQHSLMLCRFHHREYDAHRIVITALTRKGADGALKFWRARTSPESSVLKARAKNRSVSDNESMAK